MPSRCRAWTARRARCWSASAAGSIRWCCCTCSVRSPGSATRGYARSTSTTACSPPPTTGPRIAARFARRWALPRPVCSWSAAAGAWPAWAGASAAVLFVLSVGCDSVVLLHPLCTQPGIRDAGLRAIHDHHGLQSAADDWASNCRALCEALDVPLQVVDVDVERDSGFGLEAAARAARRRAFAAALRDDEVLALAHHRDDQAETFLLRALRASGPDGLAAMLPWQGFANGWLWRPQIGVPRASPPSPAPAGKGA